MRLQLGSPHMIQTHRPAGLSPCKLRAHLTSTSGERIPIWESAMTSQPLEADERRNEGLFILWLGGIHLGVPTLR